MQIRLLALINKSHFFKLSCGTIVYSKPMPKIWYFVLHSLLCVFTLTVWLIRVSVSFSKHCTLHTQHGKDGWATLLGYYSHIYLETVGRVLEVRNNSSQRLVPSLRKRRRTTMGHLTVMKSMGTCWQIHLEPQWERERGLERGGVCVWEKEREWERGRRRRVEAQERGWVGGRQWLNTGLTKKAA